MLNEGEEGNASAPAGRKKMIAHQIVGSLYYVAPEVLLGEYCEKCDVWSVGVMVYQLLTGHTPFWGPTDRDVRRAILSAPLSFEKKDHAGAAPKLSDAAKDFVATLLNRDVGNRPSAAQALDLPWLVAARKSAPPPTALSAELTQSGHAALPLSIFHSMAAFKNFSAIRKTALEVRSCSLLLLTIFCIPLCCCC